MSIKQTVANRTNSSLFLLPGIGLYAKNLRNWRFLNAFIADSTGDHYPNCVYLLFKPEDIVGFNSEFVDTEYKRSMLLINDYDYEGGYVVLVYQFPTKFEHEYKLFLKGKYSQFRKEYKDLFPDEVYSEDAAGAFTQPSFYHHVFNRTKDLEDYWFKLIGEKLDKTGEYWSIPDPQKETLNINKIRQENDGTRTSEKVSEDN